MACYSAVKRNEALNLENNYAPWKKPAAKGHVYGSIHVKCPEKVNHRDRKQVGGCQGLGWGWGEQGEGGWGAMPSDTGFLSGVMKVF